MTFILAHLFKDAALSILLALIALESEVPILHAPYNNARSIFVTCVPYSYAYIDTCVTSVLEDHKTIPNLVVQAKNVPNLHPKL